jgi:hypothetical protein
MSKEEEQKDKAHFITKPGNVFRLVEVAAMLAEELTELHKQHGVYWEEAGESSPALIAYRKLAGE